MSVLTDFLLARIDEDEAVAQGADIDPPRKFPDQATKWHVLRWDPVRVLAECEAKRRIVDDHEWDEVSGRTRVLRFLALPYADHPAYRQEWKP